MVDGNWFLEVEFRNLCELPIQKNFLREYEVLSTISSCWETWVGIQSSLSSSSHFEQRAKIGK